jgi:nucleotide-binding universal stress UspA family protein
MVKEIQAEYIIRPGAIAEVAKLFVEDNGVDLVITSTRGKSGVQHWIAGGVSRKLAQKLEIPILLVKTVDEELPAFSRILVALDGSIRSEFVLPYARYLAKVFHCELILLCVPEVPEVADYRAAADVVNQLRYKAEVNMQKFLDAVARSLREDEIVVRTMVSGNRPAATIVDVADEVDADLIMITSRGRGGMDLFMMGSVAHRIVEGTARPVFLVPVHKDLKTGLLNKFNMGI